MSLPTPTKTYLVDENTTLTTSGPLPGDYLLRKKDIADWLGIMVTKLVSHNISTPLIVHKGSSDGVSRSTIAGGGVTNYWVQNSTDLKTSIYTITAYAFAADSIWVVLEFSAAGQLMLGFEKSTNYWKVGWSPGNHFIDPVGTDLPTASDYVQIQNMTFADAAAIFNMNNQGIVNSSQDHTSYDHKVQVVLANDGSGFYCASFRDNAVGYVMYFSGLDNTVGAPWSSAVSFFMGENPSERYLVKRYNSGWGTSLSVTGSAMQLNTPSATIPYVWNSDDAVHPVIWNVLGDSDISGGFDMFPIPVYSKSVSGTATGIKGTMRDLWWGQDGGSLTVYPSTGSAEFVQIGQVVFPWLSTAATPEFI